MEERSLIRSQQPTLPPPPPIVSSSSPFSQVASSFFDLDKPLSALSAQRDSVREASQTRSSFPAPRNFHLDLGQLCNQNEPDFRVLEYDVEVIDLDPAKVEEMAKKKEISDEEDLDSLQDRPPVLTIKGHVDHGKTTLLDYIRKTKVSLRPFASDMYVNATTRDIITTTERLEQELEVTTQRQEIASCFLRDYQLSNEEALSHVQTIHANCKVLLRTHHQVA